MAADARGRNGDHRPLAKTGRRLEVGPRDVERDAYSTLLSKQTEVQVSDALTGSEVRFASEALVPDQRTVGRSLYALVGAVAGFIIALLIALIMSLFPANSPIKERLIANPLVRVVRWVFNQ